MIMNHKIPSTIKRLSRVRMVGPVVDRTYRYAWRSRFMRNWRKVNSEPTELYEKNKPTLTPVQARVIADLKNCGIAFALIDELVSAEDRALWIELDKDIKEWLQRPDVANPDRSNKGWKDYIIRYYGAGLEIKEASSLLRLGLSGSILNVANAYLGMWSKLNYIDAWNTVPEPAEKKGPAASQRWHRDPEDMRLCKIFLYHSNVDDGAGPLHYLPNCRPGEQYGNLWPQELPSGAVVADTEFETKAPRSVWKICRGAPGTIVFADTVGFHMGGRATLSNRVFSHWTFTTPGSHWPRASIFSSEVQKSFTSPAAKFAMTSGRLH